MMTHSQTNRKMGMGIGAQVHTPLAVLNRIVHAGPSRATSKSNHNYRAKAMHTIINASSGANASTPLSVCLQNPFLPL